MELKIFLTAKKASKYVAKEIADFISQKNSKNEKSVLGLATGNTPIQLYQELIEYYKQGLSFKNVITFNLDEYYPMIATRKESYHMYMKKHFFDHVDVLDENINIPDGSIPGDHVNSYCIEYENKIMAAGGIDIQILGIGSNGHIGFNEPGSLKDSKTRLIQLDETTRKDAAEEFGGLNYVPKLAITMGVETILNANKIYLMTLGNKKAQIVKECLYGEISSDRSASYLQDNEAVEVILDDEAGMLIRKDKIN